MPSSAAIVVTSQVVCAGDMRCSRSSSAPRNVRSKSVFSDHARFFSPPADSGRGPAVERLTFEVHAGERLGILGLTINAEKEVVYIVVPSDQADSIFERIFVTAKIDTPGMGILWMTPLEKMATYVPHEVAARFGLHAEPKK